MHLDEFPLRSWKREKGQNAFREDCTECHAEDTRSSWTEETSSQAEESGSVRPSEGRARASGSSSGAAPGAPWGPRRRRSASCVTPSLRRPPDAPSPSPQGSTAQSTLAAPPRPGHGGDGPAHASPAFPAPRWLHRGLGERSVPEITAPHGTVKPRGAHKARETFSERDGGGGGARVPEGGPAPAPSRPLGG